MDIYLPPHAEDSTDYTATTPCDTDDSVNEYVRRKEVLFELGFLSYRHYLRSKEWKEIRARKLKQDPFCYGCKKTAQQVHHEHYSREVMSGATLVGLYSICKKCHHWIEFTKDGDKRQPKEATDELKRMHKITAGFSNRKVDNRRKIIRRTQSIRRRTRH